ncbi:hypothetical protein BCL67_10961 [Nesterenkonia sandarakina]|uniref:Uncharacterized protein n=1 Tax=Nesterenkonia sandarakina TaxID=272918 RepID=A0A2T0YIX6_9MICC|nr:hypothetical protein BCL67_10961 [Nesterenkonia sandarakina]
MSTGARSGEHVRVSLQDTPLDDDRWAEPGSRFHTHRPGVWELLTGTEVLPRYPGARVTRWEVPGGQGERRAQHMPVNARVIPIRIRFEPICTDPAHPMYQREGRDAEERYGFLAQNMREFMWRTRVGTHMSGGNLRMTRTLTAGEHFRDRRLALGSNGMESCVGYFESDWDVEVADAAKFATVTALFRNPTGTWYSRIQYAGSGNVTALEPGRTYGFDIPMGDAPVEDALIGLRIIGDAGPMSDRWARFTNDMGAGFRAINIPDNRWWIFHSLQARAGSTGSVQRRWDVDFSDDSKMVSVGRRLGTSLLITPGIAGVGSQVGRINVRVGKPAYVHFAVRSKWF